MVERVMCWSVDDLLQEVAGDHVRVVDLERGSETSLRDNVVEGINVRRLTRS